MLREVQTIAANLGDVMEIKKDKLCLGKYRRVKLKASPRKGWGSEMEEVEGIKANRRVLFVRREEIGETKGYEEDAEGGSTHLTVTPSSVVMFGDFNEILSVVEKEGDVSATIQQRLVTCVANLTAWATTTLGNVKRKIKETEKKLQRAQQATPNASLLE
ncbi:Exocyst complex component 2 [Bienertia sinuspersici]